VTLFRCQVALPAVSISAGRVRRRVDTISKEDQMQYMLLVYDVPSEWPEDLDTSSPEYQAIYAEYAAVSQDKATKHSAQLQPAEQAKTVRIRDGQTLVTDGPFAETKEHLGGYYLVEADSPDEALALAARIPSARMGGCIEVRPVVEM
jgi:hypothetical protein